MMPTIMELMPGVIKALSDGEFHTKKEIDAATISEFGVTESELKEKLKYGASKYKNRVGWALINLKTKGLILKEGLGYKLTETGKKAASDSPAKVTAKYVKSLSKKDDEEEKNNDNAPKSDGGGGGKSDKFPEKETPKEPVIETAEEEKKAEPIKIDVNEFAGIDPECDFMLAINSKLGDVTASKKLWNRYKRLLCGMFRHCANLTVEERESEAALVFARKLELFNPFKVRKAPEIWTFSYMLSGGAKNAVDKIIRHSIREMKENSYSSRIKKVKTASVAAEDIQVKEAKEMAKKSYRINGELNNFDSGIGSPVLTDIMELNPFDFSEKYSPEKEAMKAMSESLEDKETELMSQLTPFQIKILQFKQMGQSIREIADEMSCNVRMINKNLVKAKEVASYIFGVNYC